MRTPRGYTRDNGRFVEDGVQELASNHLKVYWSIGQFFKMQSNILIRLREKSIRSIQWLCEHPFVLFLLWSLGLSCEYFIFGPYSFVRIPEDGSAAMTGRLLLYSGFASSKLGYWNPSQLCGNDTILGSFIFDLDSLPFLFLPGWLATGVVMWLQRFVAGYFTFRLVKETLHLGSYSALYGGLAYALHANYPITGWPLGFPLFYSLGIPAVSFFIWSISRLKTHKITSYLFAFGIGCLFSITNNIAFGLFVLPVIFFWFIFVVPRLDLKFWSIISIFVIGFMVLELPILWANSLNAPLSQRAYYNITTSSGAIILKALFVKDLLPLGIAIIGLMVSRCILRPLVAFVSAIIFSLIFVILVYPYFSLYIHPHLGFLRGFQFDRLYLLYPYLTIMASAIGISCLRYWKLGFFENSSKYYDFSLYTAALVVTIGLTGWQAIGMKVEALPKMLIGANYTSLYHNQGIQQLAEAYRNSSPFRVVTIRDRNDDYPYHMYPAASSVYGLESADGYVSVYFRRYQKYWEQVIWQLLQSEPDHSSFSSWGHRVYIFKGIYDLKLLSLANVRFIISDYPLDDKELVLLPFGSFNREEQLALQSKRDKNLLKAVLEGYRFPNYPTFIYENPQVFPRFFLADNFKYFEKTEQLLAALRCASYADLRSTVYLEKGDSNFSSLNKLDKKRGSIEIESHTSDKIILKVKNPQNSILVITNNFSPYWKATIDGIETKLFPVDHTFQGIYVSGGEHKIKIEYSPPYAIHLSF